MDNGNESKGTPASDAASNPDRSANESMETDSSTWKPESITEHLVELRSSLQLPINQMLTFGKPVYFFPKEFILEIIEADDEKMTQLLSEMDQIDLDSLVDHYGNLFPVEQEPVETTYISEKSYQELINCIRTNGSDIRIKPVTRYVVQGSDGLLTVERFPPAFVIHVISRTGPTTRSHGNHERHSNVPSTDTVLLSLLRTLSELVTAVSDRLHLNSSKLRLWFATSDHIDSTPRKLSLQSFVLGKYRKKLVCKEMLAQTLQSQGVTSSRYHVVAELMDSNGQFEIDSYISTISLTTYDTDAVLHAGGNLGLSNMGNTCYMNSALQCLVHIPELNNYFFFDLFQKDLNKLNPLGCNGEIATTFSGLLHKLFDYYTAYPSYITPREFKLTVGRYSSMFHGYQQQDSQEFTSWLLDTLHEDLNRIHKKPYLAKPELKDEEMDSASALKRVADTCWDQHKMRNDSVIVDLFTGLYQSTLVCPTCEKKSVTFDPFNDLTLPLPQSVKWYHSFTIVDMRYGEKPIPLLTLEVELLKTSNLDDLLLYLANFLKVDKRELFLFEIFRQFFYKNFHEDILMNKFLPICELISSTDTVFVYVIPHDPVHDLILPVINVYRDEDLVYSHYEPFAFPTFMVLPKTDALDFELVYAKVKQATRIFSKEEITDVFVDDSAEKASSVADVLLPTTAEPEIDTEFEQVEFEKKPSFQIRVFEDGSKGGYSSRLRLNQRTTKLRESSEVIHVPLVRPSFSNLPLLESKLTNQKLKSLPASSETETEGKDSDLMIVVSDVENDFVVVHNGAETGDSEEPAIQELSGQESIAQQEKVSPSDGSSSDSDEVWDRVGPLSASVDALGNTIEESDLEQEKSQSKTLSDDFKSAENQALTMQLCLVVEWCSKAYDHFFREEARAWEDIALLHNPKVEAGKRKQKQQQQVSVSLLDCLRNFGSPEVLGEQDLWYCPQCKDHKRATKTIQIWSTGDILTIHLKRFQTSRSFSDKLNVVVDFPVEGLDISKFVTSKADNEDLIYDLIAVDNHYGGLGGGHYTAAARNFRDNKWYYFDDSRVTHIENPALTITSAAYLLFYRKRSSQPYVGGESVQLMLSKGLEDFKTLLAKSREHLSEILQEVEIYRSHEKAGVADSAITKNSFGAAEQRANTDGDLLNISDGGNDINFKGLEDEDLYLDSVNPPNEAETQKSGSKNLRSPATTQLRSFEYENQRKQRLISKDRDEPRSVNINLGLLASPSNLASPEVLSDASEMPLGG